MPFPSCISSRLKASNSLDCGRSSIESATNSVDSPNLSPGAKRRLALSLMKGSLTTPERPPASSGVAASATVARDSLRAPSVTEFENPLDRSFVGFEGVAVTGNRIHNFLQKLERRFDVLVPVKRHKTSREQFRRRAARGKLRQHVPPPMLQNKNPRQRRTPRRRIHRLSMPRRSIHPHPASRVVIPSEARNLLFFSVTSSTAAHSVIPPHNNPVVAQNLNLFERSPQPGSSALPRSRMPHKQVSHPTRPNNPAPMQLNRLLLSKPVHDQQLVEWITQRSRIVVRARKTFSAHLKSCLPELAIHQQPLVRLLSQDRCAEIKLEFCSVLVQPPYGTRIKKLFSHWRAQLVRPLDSNINIGFGSLGSKQFQRGH